MNPSRAAQAAHARGVGHVEATLRQVLDAMPDPAMISDAEQRIVVSNRRADHLLRCDIGDSEGRRRAVEINEQLFAMHLARTDSGVQTRELNLVDPETGSDLLFEVLTNPLDSRDLPHGARMSVLRDVTDLKHASMELERQFMRLRRSEADATRERGRLNLILDSVADPILVADPSAAILLMNRPAERLFERGDRARGAGRAAHVRANDAQLSTLVSDFATSTALHRRERISLVDPDSGSELPVEIHAGKILSERGEPEAIVSVLHDLTQQVENERLYEELKRFSTELEDRIRTATRDLAVQNQRLQWQSAELAKASRLKSEFLASMSHELRTPINALLGYASLMSDRIYGELTPRQEDALARIAASSQHLLALINDILDLAKIESGKLPVHLEQVNLTELMDSTASELEPLARAKGLEFTWSVDPDVRTMRTDATKVRQIVLNLLSNAVKFTHEGSVRVRARMDGDMVRVTVADTGIGIAAADLPVIFEEFRQADQSRTREYPGTGLGLSITRKLLDLLHGEIAVTSEPGRGTTFTVRIPLRGLGAHSS